MNNEPSLQELIQAISIRKKKFQLSNNHSQLVAGLYCRLSRDDGDFLLESASISTQKLKLKKYATENNIQIYDFFVDDGISGTTFDRPAFTKMLECIETNKINCVIVKDASRFGRDTTICNMLIERFVLNGIRYIAIDNGVDIDIHSYAFTDSMQLQITNLFNEFYAADISRKVRSALRTKAENGQYLAKAPYGYIRSNTQKNKLIIEPAQADVVRLIFKMYLDGNSINYIARFLHRNKILTASDISYGKKEYNWGVATVGKILSNDVYTGKITYGKTSKISHKSNIMIINQEIDWISIEYTHEAIISVDDFTKVAEKLEKNKLIIRTLKNTHPFTGLLTCPHCARHLNYFHEPRKSNENEGYYCCYSYVKYGKNVCSRHYIRRSILFDTVKNDILRLKATAENNLSQAYSILSASKKSYILTEIKNMENIISSLKSAKTDNEKIFLSSYTDLKNGLISQEQFQILNEHIKEKSSEIDIKMQAFIEKKNSILNDTSDIRKFLDLILSIDFTYWHFRELSTLIDKILVYDRHLELGKKVQKISIFYKYIGCFEDIIIDLEKC